LLARDIQAGLTQYLSTAYEPADPFFRGIMARFLARDGAWRKGPYVQLGLPFRLGAKGKGFFSAFETHFPGFAHQEAAWERLTGEPKNTLVATGTGSGKTECFLYPVLDHCRAAGGNGIKALVIYPMNALASDQARRIAAAIHGTPALRKLRVGLYVGGMENGAGGGTVMTPDGVITDRDTLRKNPPDILLTNYKMLDYLLLRPQDRALWAGNSPDTLRFVVVDELHTFDGAQGTDLALLLRRLKARLGAKENPIAYVGTSATLGNATDTSPLRDYAGQVFGSPFDPDSVVTENRFRIDEFLGGVDRDYAFEARADLERVLAPGAYGSQEAAVAAWLPVFFPEVPAPISVADPTWRQELGRLLMGHALFEALLAAVEGGATSLDALHDALAEQVPAATRPQLPSIVDALLTLVAWARSADSPALPLVTLRVQTWLRELRRMVAPLTPRPDAVELLSESELSSIRENLYLPLIQCAECHTTGWLGKLATKADNRVIFSLDEIYNAWFSHNVEAVRLYPGLEASSAQVEGIAQFLCCTCGALQPSGGDCIKCGGAELLSVFRTTGQNLVSGAGKTAVYHDSSCPRCGASNAQLLIGSRSTTLGAQVVERSWGSLFNDDRKLIAFSDSVQDAAHRAGFIGARTYIHTVRSALAKAVGELVPSTGALPWSEFRARFETLWREPTSILAMPPERFVAEFLAPNMTWQRAWTDLYKDAASLPPASPLVERVQRRLGWQSFAEFTYHGNRGRNLERLGVATLVPALADIQTAAGQTRQTLQDRFGVEATEDAVFWWLWGLVIHLRRRGALHDPALGSYAEDGNLFKLSKAGGRALWMPELGPRITHPTFLGFGDAKGFDRVVTPGKANWYEQWLLATLTPSAPLLPSDRAGLYRVAVDALAAVGVVLGKQVGNVLSVGLNPDRMYLSKNLRQLQSDSGARRLIAPTDTAALLLGMPCLDAPQENYRALVKPSFPGAAQLERGALRRVIAAEHTGLLERGEREALETRFKSSNPKPWFENLLSATPTLEMGVDIGDLSSVMLCSVPPTVASFLQRVGRAGRRDGNASAVTFADGVSPHDLYFFEEPSEMIAGEVAPPGIFLQAPEVLRRQYVAFCLDDWVLGLTDASAFPEKTVTALDAVQKTDKNRFPYNFIEHHQKNQVRLLETFLDLLGDAADKEVTARLQAFVEGAEDVTKIDIRLIQELTDLGNERTNYADRVKSLRGQVKALKAKPSDEATKLEIGELEREEGKFQTLIAELEGRQLLGALTDAGLIPNYAFPEAGIELKSVLWRKATPEDKTQSAYVSLPALRYERPAASALSEFAPENRFYANQRRVEVDQINMALAKREDWRLCPSCQHMENLELVADAHASCPRCGDALWSDSAQRRTLLRFKQAIANSNDTQVRIDDSVEEREPRFYIRQLLVDFTPADVREAWVLQSDQLPFGFEFIASASFRDVNFGELGKQGERFKVAEIDAGRPGFRLCQRCGKVQVPPKYSRAGEDDDAPQHTPDCPARTKPSDDDILPCLYLYREFQSEALRILVPFTRFGMDDRVVQSFSAAIQLGLKRRFGGQVGHLRVVDQEAPDPDGGPKRRYLLLYDSVPGGTGYLHQLLAHDAHTLCEVFTLAREALADCRCQHDPDKDGCYRCVYQYRLGRSMEQVSRRVALGLLDELVGALGTLERAETISGIALNRALDSVLEQRFLESLTQLSEVDGLPRIALVQEIVNGREGYLLAVGDHRYTVELQVDLGADRGVKRASRPDFVIRPILGGGKRKPIAVFCDGWTYHKDIARDDAAKRTAILNSGKYWVWSVVMEDVERAIQGKAEAVLPSPYSAMVNRKGFALPAALKSPTVYTFSRNAVAELLHWLGSPAKTDDSWVANAWAASMGWLIRLMPETQEDVTAVQNQNQALRAQLPLWLPEPPPDSFEVALVGDSLTKIHGVYAPKIHQELNASERAPNLIWFDDEREEPDTVRHEAWRWWLWAFNWFQAIPGAVLATQQGIEQSDYVSLNPDGATTALTVSGASDPAAAAWEEVFGQLLGNLVTEARSLASVGVRPPDDVGYSLIDGDEERSMAELVWSEEKLAVLGDEYAGDRPMWIEEGWNVAIATGSWSEAVVEALSGGKA
jgi:DEAD/DEAH box helicase domain-containing protein